jgi:hypothetical protein
MGAPVGKKLSPYLYPSGRVPGRYRVPVPELPSLSTSANEDLGGAAAAPHWRGMAQLLAAWNELGKTSSSWRGRLQFLAAPGLVVGLGGDSVAAWDKEAPKKKWLSGWRSYRGRSGSGGVALRMSQRMR